MGNHTNGKNLKMTMKLRGCVRLAFLTCLAYMPVFVCCMHPRRAVGRPLVRRGGAAVARPAGRAHHVAAGRAAVNSVPARPAVARSGTAGTGNGGRVVRTATAVVQAARPGNRWYTRAFAVSLDNRTNELNVLLVHDTSNPANERWIDFRTVGRGAGGADNVASSTIDTITNGLVHPFSTRPAAWKRDSGTGDVFHVFEVNYIPGSTLYRENERIYGRGRSGVRATTDDFMWVPVSQLVGPRALSLRGKPVDGLTLWAARQFFGAAAGTNNGGAGSSAGAARQEGGGAAAGAGRRAAVAPRVAAGGTWLTIPRAILFYENTKPYYFLTNYYQGRDSSFVCDGVRWPTSEHYFQAKKSTDPVECDNIRNLARARDAQAAGRRVQHFRAGWDRSECFRFMGRALEEKFRQNPGLAQQLLATGDAVLVENAGRNDAQWGAGADGRGHNYLGRQLMVLRESLRTRRRYDFNPATTLSFDNLQRYGFSPSRALAGR